MNPKKTKSNSLFLILILSFFLNSNLFGQEISLGRMNGNFQLEAQTYAKDSLIGAQEVSEKLLSRGFLYLNYTLGNFSANIRYEYYLNPILGIDPRYEGTGFGHRSLNYSTDFIDVTAGNFYEQFGSGIILRAYEERALGFDNAIDGARFKIRPLDGIEFTGLIGKQRFFWGLSDGILRAGDINLQMDRLFGNFLGEGLSFSLGGSVVSRFQRDQESFYYLPENVLAFATRANLSGESFNVEGEFAYKFNDPNATNKFTYNPGTALILSTTYFTEGIGISFDFHRVDNMDFRTDREAKGNNLNVNYLPSYSKQHIHRLATLYPFATKPNGEIGIQADFTFTVPKNTFLGGEHGTTFTLNYSRIHSLDTTHIDEFKYNSPFFGIGKRLFFQDINLEIIKRWSKSFESNISLIYINYDKDVMENEGAPKYGTVNSFMTFFDFIYKFSAKQSLRIELQHLFAKQDSAVKDPDNVNGNWAFFMAEYTIAPNWFFSFIDEINYGNHYDYLRLHYLTASIAYITGPTRISLSYGRQRGGIICVGGVCRPVPAANGFSLSVTSSF
ncbi:MAG: DUF6029 family protein [Candidatus Kapabacteria bacterium]|nr:DUF6029 family protein [Candidatus Kapabacteria bacterium]